MNGGILSSKLEKLYEFAKSIEWELNLINWDNDLNRRLRAIREYPFMIDSYDMEYRGIAKQLDLYSEDVNLIEFIIGWAIYNPDIILGLAERLALTKGWTNMPGRKPRKFQK